MTPSEPVRPANSAARAVNDQTIAQTMIQSVVEYQDSEEQENSRLQRLWNEQMEPAYTNLCGYRSISVILISWDEELDDLGTKNEVNQLEAIFKNTYNYRTKSKRINGMRKAQVQVNKYLSEWVYDEDGENTLLIVYYAGHGVPGKAPGQLKLAPRRTPDQDPAELNEVVWNHAEANLGDTKADVLVIFDCCYAGDLGRAWQPSLHPTRSFEFIGATSAGALTKMPGKSSFTTALIWALEKLAKDHDAFTTSELVRETRGAPDFPEAQVPVLTERNVSSYVRIQLSRMSTDADADADSRQTIRTSSNGDVQPLNPHYLELRFAFDSKPRDEEIIDIARSLQQLVKYNQLSARRIDWGGLRSSDMIKIAAAKFMESGRRRSRRASSNSQTAPNSPSSPGLLSPTSLRPGLEERGTVEIPCETRTWRKRGLGGELDSEPELSVSRSEGEGPRVLLIHQSNTYGAIVALIALILILGFNFSR